MRYDPLNIMRTTVLYIITHVSILEFTARYETQRFLGTTDRKIQDPLASLEPTCFTSR
jgi:hypothetical protein